MTEHSSNRQEILRCALKLFSNKGFDGTATADIVNAARVTKPTMHHYFGSKEGLLCEILNIHYSELLEKLREATNLPQDLPLSFYRIAKVYFDGALQNIDFFRLRVGLIIRTGEDTAYICARKYIKEEYCIIKDFFDKAKVQAGNLEGKEYLCTVGLIGTLNSAITAYLYSNDKHFLSDETIYLLRQQFLHGIYS